MSRKLICLSLVLAAASVASGCGGSLDRAATPGVAPVAGVDTIVVTFQREGDQKAVTRTCPPVDGPGCAKIAALTDEQIAATFTKPQIEVQDVRPLASEHNAKSISVTGLVRGVKVALDYPADGSSTSAAHLAALLELLDISSGS